MNKHALTLSPTLDSLDAKLTFLASTPTSATPQNFWLHQEQPVITKIGLMNGKERKAIFLEEKKTLKNQISTLNFTIFWKYAHPGQKRHHLLTRIKPLEAR